MPQRTPHPAWPAIPWADWQDTAATLHMLTQIVGKYPVQLAPWLNHSWHVTLRVGARGLETLPMPYEDRLFWMGFDFVDHQLVIQVSDGTRRSLSLGPRAVAEFYRELTDTLRDIGIEVRIHGAPNEVPDAIPFAEDTEHRSYDADAVHRFWRALAQVDRVFKRFRTRFLGKSSPVHFFWGSFDHAVTRFSGRPAPRHPGGFPNLPDEVTVEAYSHEVSSAGFWPGGGGVDEASFYSYAYPTPDGFGDAEVQPEAAYFHADLGEFVLPYDAVRHAADPDAELLAFLQSTYAAAADLAGWDRAGLECPEGRRAVPRPVG